MKSWHILKRDLLAFICSMRWGALAFIFLFFVGAFYYSFILTLIEVSSKSFAGAKPSLEQLCKAIFHNFHFILLLIVPAVTMGSFSEDRRTGVFRLLRSAPLTPLEIVIGKYLACFLAVLLVCVLSGPYFVWLIVNGNPDIGVLFSSGFGIALLVGLQIAYGILISSMTSNQFIAFLFTMGGLFLMLIVNWISPNMGTLGDIGLFVKYFATTTHLDPFLEGQIAISHVSYFLSFSLLFIFLTCLTSKWGVFSRGGFNFRPGQFMVSLVAFVLGFTIFLYIVDLRWLYLLLWFAGLVNFLFWAVLVRRSLRAFLTSSFGQWRLSSIFSALLSMLVAFGICVLTQKNRFNFSIDVTTAQSNSLSLQSQKILKAWPTSNKIDVLAFFESSQKRRDFDSLMRLYRSYAANIDIEFINPSLDPVRTLAEKVTMADTVIFRSSDKEQRITSISEESITNAILSLKSSDLKKVVFLVGHGEGDISARGPDGYSFLARDLKVNGYEVQKLNLRRKSLNPDVDLVIIVGPKYDINKEESESLKTFLEEGGGLLVLSGAFSSLRNLENLAADYGLEFGSDLLLLPEEDPRVSLLGRDTVAVDNLDMYHPITREIASGSATTILLKKSRSVSLKHSGLISHHRLLAFTSDDSVQLKNIHKPSDLKSVSKDDFIKKSSGTVGVSIVQASSQLAKAKNLTKASDVIDGGVVGVGRLIAVGAHYFANNRGVQRGENVDLLMSCISFLLRQESFIPISKTKNLSALAELKAGSLWSLFLLSWVYPFVFLMIGLWFWKKGRPV